MEAVSCEQPPLPRLRIKEDGYRRDSITSSKTADSGYNSDPDISLSPLEVLASDQQRLIAPDSSALPPPIPSVFLEAPVLEIVETEITARPRRLQRGAHGLAVLAGRSNALNPLPNTNLEVTSNPTFSSCVKQESKPDWTNVFRDRFKTSDPTVLFFTESEISKKEKLEDWVDESAPFPNRPKERLSSIVSISTCCSGGDYSVTDDSESEEQATITSTMFSKATLTTIELVMRKIEINLNYVAYLQCAGGQGTRSRATGEMPTGRRGSMQASSGKRKARIDEALPPEDQDDDGPNKRRRVSITTTEDSEIGPRFACPFYKHDPSRYRNRRTCPGPGWPTVHRMKEHLYRSHAQPIFCPRCYTMFDADSDLSNHLRSDPCSMSAPQPIEGIDRETLKLLRKRSPPLRIEEDKWRDTYQLLFPSVSDTDIPSPYYDGDSPTEESRRFRRELLRRIQEELFATAEQAGGAVEQNLLRQVAGIIRGCENELLNTLYPAQSAPPEAPMQTYLENAPRDDRSTDISPGRGASGRGPAHASGSLHGASSTNSSSFIGNMNRPQPASSTMAQSSEQPMAQGQQYIPDAPGQGSAMPWDSSEWIDWNAVFPPGPEVQGPDRGESFQALNTVTPVWT